MNHSTLFDPHGPFQAVHLDQNHTIYTGMLPVSLRWTEADFSEVWDRHPADRMTIMMYGKPVVVPRWMATFQRPYHFSGQTLFPEAATPPRILELLLWANEAINSLLNGILVLWYDGARNDYIGPHRDSIDHMIPGAPIVTVSFGEERIFRIRKWKSKEKPIDLPAATNTVFVMPFDVNRAFTHEVPKSASRRGRRISVTLRAFSQQQVAVGVKEVVADK